MPNQRRSWTTGEVFKRLDAFGERIPTFKIQGRDKINTNCGSSITISLLLIVIMYGGLRASNMVTRQNPNISSYYIENVMNEKPINLNDRNLKMAFTIESFYSPL